MPCSIPKTLHWHATRCESVWKYIFASTVMAVSVRGILDWTLSCKEVCCRLQPLRPTGKRHSLLAEGMASLLKHSPGQKTLSSLLAGTGLDSCPSFLTVIFQRPLRLTFLWPKSHHAIFLFKILQWLCSVPWKIQFLTVTWKTMILTPASLTDPSLSVLHFAHCSH